MRKAFLALIIGALVCIPAFSTTSSFDYFRLKEASAPVLLDEGVLFTFKPDRTVKSVMVSGEFDNWRKPHPMFRNENGVYFFIFDRADRRGLVIDAGRYRYRFLVDGMWIPDPANGRRAYDPKGTELSYFVVEKPLFNHMKNPYRLEGNTYVFYFRSPTAHSVYLVGTFNHWNPYSLPLSRNAAGIWEVEVDITPGKHAYRFLVDGRYEKDPMGKTVGLDRFDEEYTLVDLPAN
jgi:1,4-alpha-glucan branching enzyme